MTRECILDYVIVVFMGARIAAIFGTLTVAALLLPQEPPTQELPPTISVDVDVVNILCSVRDKNGRLVKDLKKEDFIVKEDGKEQEIKYFARQTDLPLTIGLLVDVSKSQENLLEIERHAALQFFSEVLRKGDLAFLISFGVEAELLQDLTGSTRLLQKALDELKLNAAVGGIHPGPVPTSGPRRGTILYDAVYLAARERLQREVGRKAMVLITDGVDVGSRISRSDAIEAAQRADSIVYSIYYVDPSAYGGYGWFGSPSDSDIKKMSEETGGRLFKVERKHPLAESFQEIQEEMRSQYAIGYSPTNAEKDGTFREVEIKTRDKNLKVQARKGYYAGKSR